jgi:hypothetical protein
LGPLWTLGDAETLEYEGGVLFLLFSLFLTPVYGWEGAKDGSTSPCVQLLQGGTTADDVIPPAAVETFEFGVLQTVGD